MRYKITTVSGRIAYVPVTLLARRNRAKPFSLQKKRRRGPTFHKYLRSYMKKKKIICPLTNKEYDLWRYRLPFFPKDVDTPTDKEYYLMFHNQYLKIMNRLLKKYLIRFTPLKRGKKRSILATGANNVNVKHTPTKNMWDFYKKRTRKHINKVRKYCRILAENLPGIDSEALIQRGLDHDLDKWDNIPYVWITEFYRCKNLGKEMNPPIPEGMQEQMDKASDIHMSLNTHHPEAHEDLNLMSDEEKAEMVGDWASMAEEYGEKGPRKWADDNVGKKWKFNKTNTNFIYECIDVIESFLA